MVTYSDLQFNQRCVYQAFSQLKTNSMDGSAMGGIVNSKGYDADDDMAVAILARHFGMKPGFGGTGQWFLDEVRFESGSEIIASIYTGIDYGLRTSSRTVSGFPMTSWCIARSIIRMRPGM